MLFLHRIASLWTTAPHVMPWHVSIDGFSSHERKNETDFSIIFEILKLITVFELEGIETSEKLETVTETSC
jgi:hypothetical protein